MEGSINEEDFFRHKEHPCEPAGKLVHTLTQPLLQTGERFVKHLFLFGIIPLWAPTKHLTYGRTGRLPAAHSGLPRFHSRKSKWRATYKEALADGGDALCVVLLFY